MLRRKQTIIAIEVSMIGFKEPGVDRGIALSITTEVHAKEAAQFVTDDNGLIRWGIRREEMEHCRPP